MSAWQPISDLSDALRGYHHNGLKAFADIWNEQRQQRENTRSYQIFLERLRRKIAIETGVIERLYSIDRGITMLLIERGIDEALIPHGRTDRPAAEVVALIRDQQKATDQVFDFVGSQRSLSNSFIKQIHQLLTRNQTHTQALDQFGNLGTVSLIRGDWKHTPNNPLRPDGTVHEYCPPEQVASQMDQLIQWHHEHESQHVSPEVEAAWLHHRFTQIHPFQDGNGRVARNLASLVFIKSGWFPLTISNDEGDVDRTRIDYIDALEKADAGDLMPLIALFGSMQKRTFLKVLSLSEEVIDEQLTIQSIIHAAVSKIEYAEGLTTEKALTTVQTYSEKLWDVAQQEVDTLASAIQQALRDHSGSARIRHDGAKANEERSGFYKYQISETARHFGYYANLRSYKSWLLLLIRVHEVQTEILLSFHPIGHEPYGIMVCTACAYRRLRSDDEQGATSVQDLQVLSDEPFQFTHLQPYAEIEREFKRWLKDVLIVGVQYWNSGL